MNDVIDDIDKSNESRNYADFKLIGVGILIGLGIIIFHRPLAQLVELLFIQMGIYGLSNKVSSHIDYLGILLLKQL